MPGHAAADFTDIGEAHARNTAFGKMHRLDANGQPPRDEQ